MAALGFAPVTPDFCETNALVEFRSSSLSFSNLERVITHLLSELAAQRKSAEKERAKRETIEAKLAQRIDVVEETLNTRRGDLEEQMKEALQRLHVHDGRLDELGAGIDAVKEHGDAASSELDDKVAKVVETGRRETKRLERLLDDALFRVDTLSDAVRGVEDTTSRLPVATLVELPTHMRRLTEIVENTKRDQGKLELRVDCGIEDMREATREQLAPMQKRVGQAEAELQNQQQKLMALAGWRTDVDASISDILTKQLKQLDGNLEQLASSLNSLHVSHNEARQDTRVQVVELRTRLEEAERKLASMMTQLKLRGDVVDEDDAAAGSALALLSQKVSDILNILILFESKLHKTETNADRMENHLISALQTVTAGKWSQAGVTRGAGRRSSLPKGSRRQQRVVIDGGTDTDAGTDDVPLLRTKKMFRCLSCNHPQRSENEQVSAEGFPEAGVAPPWGVLRSPPRRSGEPMTGLAGLSSAPGIPSAADYVPVVTGSVPHPNARTPPSFQPYRPGGKSGRPHSAPYRRSIPQQAPERTPPQAPATVGGGVGEPPAVPVEAEAVD
eukprot:TRINITY_DN47014_c0_g1_i1.p1 TRINITY_DN47014_c0_g1~~TRINITY_DN47014_c0_g1_i1.p1  ORF type:complete len:562 (+),score=209.47 TRINITY_DN47014_c0_g1_i1:60-1745(+)